MSGNGMGRSAYTLFDTEFGQCGIVWKQSARDNTVVVVGFQLPEVTPRQAERRIMGKWGANRAEGVPPAIQDVIRRVRLHFKGRAQDFRDVVLDLDGLTPFARQIYETAREVLPGQTATYGRLAAMAGYGGAARAVGLAMSRNPIPLIIPCHRVLAAGKRPGGFSASGGLNTKARMLAIEGVTLDYSAR